MSESVEETVIHEAYAFACMNCGFGWEQDYEIQHQPDADGRQRTLYRANGVPVPSPLTKPSCPGCAGDHVRIMRAGRVSEMSAYAHPQPRPAAHPAPPQEISHAPARPRKERRLHLPFHLHLRRNHHGTPEV